MSLYKGTKMTLSEELNWRGLINQTTYKDIKALDGPSINFYWGVDPSADSMTVGNLAAAMLVKRFIKYGHRPVLLIGGATGMIGDPDGKSNERQLLSSETLVANKAAIAAQYQQLFEGQDFDIVDNYDWFKDFNYLTFLREVGKNVPTRQMLGREFVQSRLGEKGEGISYAEFSYVLIQAYDYLHLYERMDVKLQVCGSDQWGNCVAGVDLIRRKTGGQAHVFSTPLVVNSATGQKFGKSEAGAIWLDPKKTTPTQFYQFWINTDDSELESYLKIFTELNRAEIATILSAHAEDPGKREVQNLLAINVTRLVHGEAAMQIAQKVTDVLTGKISLGDAETVINELKLEIPSFATDIGGSIVKALVNTNLANSNSEAIRLIKSNAISINDQKIQRNNFEPNDFQNGRLLLRRGKAFKDSALIVVQPEFETDII